MEPTRLATLVLFSVMLSSGVLLSGCECGGCETSCDGECVDVTSDPMHRGGCRISCGGADCVDGVCGLACGPGQMDCGGECVDPMSDPSHCGRCAMACSGTCESGVCSTDAGPGVDAGMLDAGSGCPPEQMLCRTGCVTRYSSTHCGSTEERGCLEMPCGSNDGCNGVSCEVTTSALDRVITPDALIGGAVIGLFNFVCPSSLTPEVATVVCRRWGLTEGEVIDGDFDYPAGSTPYVVTCTGTESSLEDCVNTETTRDAACLEPARLVRCR